MNSILTFNIPSLVNTAQDTSGLKFSIVNCTFPNAFYLVNGYTNSLDIMYEGDVHTFFILQGNYNAYTMLTMVLSLLPASFSMTYSTQTGRYTLTNNSFVFSILYSSSCAKILGLYDRESDNTAVSSGDLFVLEFPYRVNFFPSQLITIRSNQFQFNNLNYYDKTSDILMAIPNSAGPNGMVVYNSSSNLRFHLDGSEDKSFFTIRISDETNRLYDFQNSDWTITFAIESSIAPSSVRLGLPEYLSKSRKRMREELDNLEQMDAAFV